jgi:hypothetical protein
MDGSFTIFVVQHRWKRRGEWADSDLGVMLFGDMNYQDRRGERGARYRALLQPQHECWQQTRVGHGFLDEGDAWAAYNAARAARGDHQFRVVRRVWAQITQPIKRPAARRRAA